MGSSQSSLALRVDLSGKGIKDLEKDLKQPHMLPTFTKLEALNVSKNKISMIPESIAADLEKSPKVIEYLQILSLQKNRLGAIPDSVWLLVNLKALHLDNNCITTISEKILAFYRLESFTISNNKVRHLPWSIKRLHALRELAVDSNDIRFFPNPLGSMVNLEIFAYKPNPIDRQYESFTHLKDLFAYIRTQKVPPEYRDESRRAKEEADSKTEKLSADGRIVRALVSYREGLDALEEHMKKEFSHENLLLYLAVREFRRKYNSTVEIRTTELVNEAKKLFEEFIAEDGKHQVNLPAQVVDPLKKIFLDAFNFPRGISQRIFDDAYKASFDLMVRDTFLRFRTTERGKALLTQLRKVEGDRLKLPE